jgi:hypothetical protein
MLGAIGLAWSSSDRSGRWRWLQRLREERGLTVVEELISTTVIAVVAISVLTGLSVISLGSAGQSERATAEALLVAQAEAIKAADFDGVYGVIEAPSGYSLRVEGPTRLTSGLQEVTIRVYHGSREVRRLTLLKGDRAHG